jgi:hypothetical protein
MISAIGGGAPKAPTLSDRLGSSAQKVENLCNRMEYMLSRVNGTPSSVESNLNKATAATPPMVASMEQLENQIVRLQGLIDSAESIA